MFTIEFQLLDEPATRPYQGEFQNQGDFPKVQREFILNAHTASLAEINSLPREIGHIRQRVMLHEKTHHRPHTARWQEMAAAQGVKPIESPDELIGGWPEDEDFDSFLNTILTSREPQPE